MNKTMQHTAAAGAAAPSGGGSGNGAFCPAPYCPGAGCRTGKAGSGMLLVEAASVEAEEEVPACCPVCRWRTCRLFSGYGGAVQVQVTMETAASRRWRFWTLPTRQSSSAPRGFDHRSGCPELGGGCCFRSHLHQPGHSGRGAERPEPARWV